MIPEHECIALYDAPEIGWTRNVFMTYVEDHDWTESELRHLAAWTAKHQAMVLRCYGLGDTFPMLWSNQIQDQIAARMGLPTPQNDPDVIGDPESNLLARIQEEIEEATRDYDPDEPIDDIDYWCGLLISDEDIRHLTRQTT